MAYGVRMCVQCRSCLHKLLLGRVGPEVAPAEVLKQACTRHSKGAGKVAGLVDVLQWHQLSSPAGSGCVGGQRKAVKGVRVHCRGVTSSSVRAAAMCRQQRCADSSSSVQTAAVWRQQQCANSSSVQAAAIALRVCFVTFCAHTSLILRLCGLHPASVRTACWTKLIVCDWWRHAR